jgi:methionyl-tRNA synthetase
LSEIHQLFVPFELATLFGTDALRYFLLRELHPFEDSPFSMKMFKEAYNANLANGLGNLVNRILKMSEKYFEKPIITEEKFTDLGRDFRKKVFSVIETFDMKQAMNIIWDKIQDMDKEIQVKRPFEVAKTDMNMAKEIVSSLVYDLVQIANALEPLLLDTYTLVKKSILSNKMPEKPLFLRKE